MYTEFTQQQQRFDSGRQIEKGRALINSARIIHDVIKYGKFEFESMGGGIMLFDFMLLVLFVGLI